MIEKPVEPKDRVILALDVDTLKEAEELVKELKDYVGYFKIGLPLTYSKQTSLYSMLLEILSNGLAPSLS